jgi:hypothetical protein
MNLVARSESLVENLSERLFQKGLELQNHAANVIDRGINASEKGPYQTSTYVALEITEAPPVSEAKLCLSLMRTMVDQS